MLNTTFSCPDLGRFCLLDRLGLSVGGRQAQNDHAVARSVGTCHASPVVVVGGVPTLASRADPPAAVAHAVALIPRSFDPRLTWTPHNRPVREITS